MRFLGRIREWARRAPERPAHVSGDRMITYGELWQRSDALAAQLMAEQPGDRSPVVVRGHKEPEMLVAFLAALKAGRCYVPVDNSIPAQRAERIIQASGATKVLLAADLATAHLSVADVTVADVTVADVTAFGATSSGPAGGAHGSPAESAAQLAREDLPEPSTDDLVYILYTSGSTGEPKGVQITGGCLDSFVDWMLAEQRFAEGGEVFLNQAPFSFDLSVMDLYCSLTTGGSLFSLDRATLENPKRLFERLAVSGVTTWVSTPSFALMCLAERSFDQGMLPGLRRFLFCGETLPPDLAVRLLERFPRAQVWNTYGPTETTVATTSVQVTPELVRCYNPLPVGYPKPDTTILVVDEQLHPVAEGERGEILIAGPNVSIGYRADPVQSARAFLSLNGQRAYRTGDWGRFQDGLLFFEGRIDFQIKLHGYRIELGDIETHLRQLPEVEDAQVAPVMRDGQVQWLAAFVIPGEAAQEGSDFARAQRLRQVLGERLPSYMLPRKFFFLEAFPMTPNGKADRRKLAERLQ